MWLSVPSTVDEDAVNADSEFLGWFVSPWSTSGFWNRKHQNPTGQWIEEELGISLMKSRFPMIPFLFGFYPGKSSKCGIQLLNFSYVLWRFLGVVWSTRLILYQLARNECFRARRIWWILNIWIDQMKQVPKVSVLLINTSFWPAIKFHKTVTLKHLLPNMA